MKLSCKYRDTELSQYFYISSDIYTTVQKELVVTASGLPTGTASVTAAQSGVIQLNAPVKWWGGTTDVINNATAVVSTKMQINGNNIKRATQYAMVLTVSALDDSGAVLATSSYTLKVAQMEFKDVTETASIPSSVTSLPVTPTCNTLSITPKLTNVYDASITYEILSYGNIEGVTSAFNSASKTATIYFCPLFYSNRHAAKYQPAADYVNLELVVRFYGISSVTGKEISGDIIYYMPVNYTYYQDIAINGPFKINYDIDNISITPSFTTDYTFNSVSVAVAGAVTKAVKSGNSVIVTSTEADTDTLAVLRFNFTSEVYEPYNFYYDIDVIKQGTPDFTVFSSNDNYTVQFTDETKWSAHAGTSSASISAGKIVPINGAARLMLGNICTLPYPVINIAPVMSDDSTHSIMWENIPIVQSNAEYRIDISNSTLWYAPRWDAGAADPVYIELSSNKLYRNTPFYITYNIGRKNSVNNISLAVYSMINGVKTAVWVKKNMTVDYGVTQVAYNYYGKGEQMVFEWQVALNNGTSYMITETAELDDTCHHPYMVYWTGSAGCVKQIALNDTSKEKVSTAFETMATPYYSNNVTREITKKWKSETTSQITAATDFLSETEMRDLSTLFASLSVYVYDAKKQSMSPATVTDKSFVVSTFTNSGRKYANASFNIEYAEKQVALN